MFLLGNGSATQKGAAAGKSGQQPADGFSVMMQALSKGQASPPVPQGTALQLGLGKLADALAKVTTDEVAGDAVPSDEGQTAVEVAGLATLVSSGKPAVDPASVAATPLPATGKATGGQPQGLALGQTVTGETGPSSADAAKVPQVGATPAQSAVQAQGNDAAEQVLSQTPARGGVVGKVQNAVPTAPTPTTVPSAQAAAQPIPSSGDATDGVVPPQKGQAAQPAQAAVPAEIAQIARGSGKAVAEIATSQPMAVANLAAGKAAEVNQPGKPNSAAEQPLKPGPTEKPMTAAPVISQNTPAVAEAPAAQRRIAAVKEGDPVLFNPVTAGVDRRNLGVDLKSIRGESLLATDQNEPAAANPSARTFLGATEPGNSNGALAKPEHPGLTPGTANSLKPQEELRPLQPALVTPQQTDLRALAPSDAPGQSGAKAPTKPMAEALMAQVRSVDVQEGRTTVNLHPRGLGTIEVEMIVERDAASKVIVRVENPMVLQTLREERQLLAQTIGVADSSVMSFEESATGGRAFGGTDDDAQPQSAFTADTDQTEVSSHTNVVDDGVVDVLT